MAQGRDNARLFLKDNSELCDEIERKLRAELAAEMGRGSDAGDSFDEE